MPTGIPDSIEFVPMSPHGGATVQITVTIHPPNSSGVFYPLYCSNPNLVFAYNQGGTSGMGGSGSFPPAIGIPAGETNATIAVLAGFPTTPTNVTVAVGMPGADMSNSANWVVSGTIRVYP